MPPEEATEVKKNASDTDTILYEAASKLFKLFKAKDEVTGEEKTEWKDLGKGTLRIVRGQGVDGKEGRSRVTLRNPTGKVILNTFLRANMSMSVVSNKYVRFSAMVQEGEGAESKMELRGFMVQVKSDSIKTLMDVWEKAAPKE